MPTHKSEDYKLSAVEYYLTEDKTQEEVCKIFKCSARSLLRWVNKYNENGEIKRHNLYVYITIYTVALYKKYNQFLIYNFVCQCKDRIVIPNTCLFQ